MVTDFAALTEFVVTVNLALLAPSGIRTVLGTVANEVFEDESGTKMPPTGAG